MLSKMDHKKEDKDNPKPNKSASCSKDNETALQKKQKSESDRLNALMQTIQDGEKTRKDLIDLFVKVMGQTVRQDKQDISENLKALFSAPVHGNIKQLHQKIIRFKSSQSVESNRFQGLRLKIHALLHGGDHQDYFQDFKIHGIADREESDKISFIDFFKDFDKSDSGYELLKSLKGRAIKHGKNLFQMVIFLMFLMSKDDDVMAKFKVVRDSLKWVSEGECSVVIERLLELLDTADMRINKNKADKDGELEEDVSDELILLLAREICYLELFWMQRRLPNSKTGFALPIADDIKRCEKVLKKLEIEVNELLETSGLNFGEGDHLILKEGDDYKAMELKINELWDQIEELNS